MSQKDILKYSKKIQVLVENVGAAILLNRDLVSTLLARFDIKDEVSRKGLITQLKRDIFDSKVLKYPTDKKEKESLEKEINNVSFLMRSGQEILETHHESVKLFFSNQINLEELIKPPEKRLHEDVRIFSDGGRYAIEKKDGKGIRMIPVTNFILFPKSIVTIENKDLEASLYNFKAVSAINGASKDIVILPSDLDTMQSFQKVIHKQAEIINPVVQDLHSHMRGMAYEVTEHAWKGIGYKQQKGTTVLGYERFSNNGEKYMCTVDGTVYNIKGEVVEDVVFIDPAIRIPEGGSSVVSKYGNMAYQEDIWKDTTKFLLSNIMKVNKPEVMANVAGWFFANAQEYNVRKVLDEFPLLHIAGPRSSGKSLTVSSIKQYFGHVGTSLPHFPTPPIFAQDMSISYTIPAICDEYGGSDKGQGWSDFTFNEVHKIMKHVYDKTPIEKGGKGDGGQGRFIYKTRNSLCSLGQIYIRDQSISTRTIQVSVDGSLKGTPEGDLAYSVSESLANYDHKDFITGYTLWCMNQKDEDVKSIVKQYREHNKNTIRAMGMKYDERQQQNDAAVQLGLHLMLKLARELGVDVGFDEEFIADTVVRNAETNERLFEQTSDDPLIKFLRDIATHVKLVGNSKAVTPIYGLGGMVVDGAGKDHDDPGKYGRAVKKDACVFNHPYIGIRVKDMITILNTDLQKRGKDAHSFADIQPYLESSFNKTKVKRGHGLVLAPDNYYWGKRHQGTKYSGWYTVFNLQKLVELVSEDFVSNKYWDNSAYYLQVIDQSEERVEDA